MDEVRLPDDQITRSPRTVSIALTNICDLKCHFCYAPKNKQTLSYDHVTNLCKQLDDIGVLEVTFGGGEPTLFPRFDDLLKWVWDNTSLGTSFTTHGHHITEEFVKNIQGKISSVRFSIDGIEPKYSMVRGRKLDNLIDKIKLLEGQIPFGINSVVSNGETDELKKVIELSIALKASNILIIPEHSKGHFQLSKSDWSEIDAIIDYYKKDIEVLVTYAASRFLSSQTLTVSSEQEILFAHISADNKVKQNSFDTAGILIDDINCLKNYFLLINPN